MRENNNYPKNKITSPPNNIKRHDLCRIDWYLACKIVNYDALNFGPSHIKAPMALPPDIISDIILLGIAFIIFRSVDF